MKKLFLYFLFVIVSVVSIYFGYGYVQSSRFDPDAVPYIEKVLPLLSRWDLQTTKELLDDEVLNQVADKGLEQMLDHLSRIGELQGFERPQFRSTSTALTAGAVEQQVVTYRVDARYSTGPAEVTLSLIGDAPDYKLLHFNFQSSALAP